ncbi:MAG: peptidase C39 family protein [Vulcanimicrobiaceae bacterium]
MLTLARPERGEETVVRFGPTRGAVVSWNARALVGALELRANAHDGRTSAWLPYVAYAEDRRASLDGRDTFVRIETDIVRADVDLVSLGVRAQGDVDAVYVSTPDYGAPSSIVALPALELDVPPLSQFVDAYPNERGWCAPTSLAMLLGYRGYPVDVPIVAREVYDATYGGTGNWAFNVAFAGTLGFRAAVVHLRDLAHAHAFLTDDMPLALSIAWKPGDLPGAPLPQSTGHIVVLRGITPDGDALVNDPAVPGVATTYAREAFERAWLGHGGIALAIVPAPLGATLLRLANDG